MSPRPRAGRVAGVQPGDASTVAALEGLINETRMLFHLLKRAAEDVHDADGLSGGARGVLLDLERRGPTTVPELARSRPVSRQHIQLIVNPLLEEKLVTLIKNPRHQRSKLVQLTAKGRQLTARIRSREAPVMTEIAERFKTEDLARTIATLRRVREAFGVVGRTARGSE